MGKTRVLSKAGREILGLVMLKRVRVIHPACRWPVEAVAEGFVVAAAREYKAAATMPDVKEDRDRAY